MACDHRQLIKVIDQIGAMTIDANGGYSARVLRAHYECADCGETVLHTMAPRAAWTDFDFDGAVHKIGTAIEAIAEARRALRGQPPKEENRD